MPQTQIKNSDVNLPTRAELAYGPAEPEWIPTPREGGYCKWTSIGRQQMLNLIMPRPCNGNNPPVKSILLRATGNVGGRRLIHLASLRAYLGSLPTLGAK